MNCINPAPGSSNSPKWYTAVYLKLWQTAIFCLELRYMDASSSFLLLSTPPVKVEKPIFDFHLDNALGLKSQWIKQKGIESFHFCWTIKNYNHKNQSQLIRFHWLDFIHPVFWPVFHHPRLVIPLSFHKEIGITHVHRCVELTLDLLSSLSLRLYGRLQLWGPS